MKYGIAFFLLMSVTGTMIGCIEIVRQHARITGFRGVRATIVSTEMVRGSRYSNKPIVRYKYEVEGQVFSCKQVCPVHCQGSAMWARSVIADFPVGDVVDAWYDPERPTQAFLIRRYRFSPYGCLLTGVFFCPIGVLTALQLRRVRKGPPKPKRLPDGWYQLRASGMLAGATRQFGYAGAAWLTVGGATFYHLFHVAKVPPDLVTIAIALAWALAGAASIGHSAYTYWLGRRMGDVVFHIDQARAKSGRVLRMRVQQVIHKASTVRALSVELRCTHSERTGTNAMSDESPTRTHCYRKTALENYEAQAGETIAADFGIFVRPDAPLSTPLKSRNRDRYVWKLHLCTRLFGVPPSPYVFFLTVVE